MFLLRFLLKLCATCLIVSCNNVRVAKFRITNLNTTQVDSLYFEPSNKSDRIFISLDPNDTKEYMLDMRAIHIDGTYAVFYKQSNEWKKRTFGHFTNGYAAEKITLIKLLPDTVTVKQIH